MAEYIERKDALYAIGTITMYKGSISHDLARRKIESIPSADVTPAKHGAWKLYHDDDDDPHFIHEWYVCSCCGGEALYRRGGYEQVKTKGCPWCGAKMEVDGDV